jgi:ferredoxin
MPDRSRLRVKVNQDVCVGAGLCVLTLPEVFDQRDEDGVVSLRTSEPSPDQREKVMSAVRKCPSRAISVEEIEEVVKP